MSHRTRLASITCLLVIVFCYPNLNVEAANPQDANKKAPQKTKPSSVKTETEDPRTIQEKRALVLLDTLSDTTKDFSNIQIKVRLQAQIADTLWDYDQPRARKAFEDVFEEITSYSAKANATRPAANTNGPASMTSSLLLATNLYGELLQIISRRDSELAKKLIDTIIDIPADKGNDYSEIVGNQRSRLNLQLASSLIDTDPQEAARLARASDSVTVNSTMVSLLIALKRKDVSAANDLFNYALSIAQKNLSNLSTSVDLLAYYVLPGYGEAAYRYNFGLADAQATIAQGDPVLVKALLGFAYKGLGASDAANIQSRPNAVAGDYVVWQRMLPYYDQYLPEGSPNVRAHLESLFQKIPAGPMRDYINNANGATDAQGLASKADSTDDPVMKDSLYSRAVMQALVVDDYEKAILIAGKIKDQRNRDAYLSISRRGAADAAIKKGDFDIAVKYASQLRGSNERASLFIAAAKALFDRKDSVRAREMIEDGLRSVEKDQDGTDKMSALVSIANTMATVDTVRSFEIMKTAIETVNHIQPPASGTDYGPTTMVNLFNSKLGFFLLGKADFDRALLLSQSIGRKEAMVSAQISLCRGVLSKLGTAAAPSR